MRSNDKTQFYTGAVEKTVIAILSLAAGTAAVLAAMAAGAMPIVSISAGFIATLSATVLSGRLCQAVAFPSGNIRRSYTVMDAKTTAYISFTAGKNLLTAEYEGETGTEGPHKRSDFASSGYCLAGPAVFAAEMAAL